jgi:hypothetical protein
VVALPDITQQQSNDMDGVEGPKTASHLYDANNSITRNNSSVNKKVKGGSRQRPQKILKSEGQRQTLTEILSVLFRPNSFKYHIATLEFAATQMELREREKVHHRSDGTRHGITVAIVACVHKLTQFIVHSE